MANGGAESLLPVSMMLITTEQNVVLIHAACQYCIGLMPGRPALFASRNFRADLDAYQDVRAVIRMTVREGQLSFITIIGFRPLGISAEIKRLVLLAGHPAICFVRRANQILDLFTGHSNLQLGEFAFRGRRSNDLSFYRPVCGLDLPCGRLGGRSRFRFGSLDRFSRWLGRRGILFRGTSCQSKTDEDRYRIPVHWAYISSSDGLGWRWILQAVLPDRFGTSGIILLCKGNRQTGLSHPVRKSRFS